VDESGGRGGEGNGRRRVGEKGRWGEWEEGGRSGGSCRRACAWVRVTIREGLRRRWGWRAAKTKRRCARGADLVDDVEVERESRLGAEAATPPHGRAAAANLLGVRGAGGRRKIGSTGGTCVRARCMQPMGS